MSRGQPREFAALTPGYNPSCLRRWFFCGRFAPREQEQKAARNNTLRTAKRLQKRRLRALQLLVFQLQRTISFFGCLQGASLFSKALLEIADSVLDVDCHAGCSWSGSVLFLHGVRFSVLR